MCNKNLLAYKTFDEFAAAYSFKDSAEMYSNGVQLIPVFRVKQWMEARNSVPEEEKQAAGLSEDDAIEMLLRLRDPEPYEPKISEEAEKAINMGIAALEEKKKRDRLHKVIES